MKFELSTLIQRTSHYFDKVFVGGAPADYFSLILQRKGKEQQNVALRELASHVELLIYIKRIGARGLISYVQKPQTYCKPCARKIASEVGFTFYENEQQTKNVIAKIVEESKITFLPDRSGIWKAIVKHPIIPGAGVWEHKFGRTRPTRKKVAERILPFLTDPYVLDYRYSNYYGLPLANAYQASWIEKPTSSLEFTADQSALEFELPVIMGLDLADLVAFQNENKEHYIQFQAAVRAAVREFMDRRDLDSPKMVAQAVVNEIIRPDLARIESQMKSATRRMSTKFAASAFIGTLVTTAGMLASVPLMIATGVGAAATSLTQLYKYIDDRSDIASADMYYLWKLEKMGHNHGTK